MWRGVTSISMLRVYVIVTVSLKSVSLRNFYLSFFMQAFTRKSNKACKFKKFQGNPRSWEHLGYSRIFKLTKARNF